MTTGPTVAPVIPGTMPGMPFGISGGTPAKPTEVSSPQQQEELIPKSKVDAMIHAAKSEQGRELKKAMEENADLKSQLTLKDGDIQDIQDEREALRKDIENLSSGDPAKFDLVKKERQLREKEQTLKSERRQLQAKEQKVNSDLAKLNAFNTDILIEDIAEGYENADVKWLRDFCRQYNITDEKAIKDLADKYWKKAENTPQNQTQPQTQQVKTLPGITQPQGTPEFKDLTGKDMRKMTPGERREHQQRLKQARANMP